MMILHKSNYEKRKRLYAIFLFIGILFTIISLPDVFNSSSGDLLYNLFTLFTALVLLFASIYMLNIGKNAKNRYTTYFDNNQTTSKSTIASELNISEYKVAQELAFFAGSNKDARKTNKVTEFQFNK